MSLMLLKWKASRSGGTSRIRVCKLFLFVDERGDTKTPKRKTVFVAVLLQCLAMWQMDAQPCDALAEA